jgi:hypothetical protein
MAETFVATMGIIRLPKAADQAALKAIRRQHADPMRHSAPVRALLQAKRDAARPSRIPVLIKLRPATPTEFEHFYDTVDDMRCSFGICKEVR